jgi:hypothetical protein
VDELIYTSNVIGFDSSEVDVGVEELVDFVVLPATVRIVITL